MNLFSDTSSILVSSTKEILSELFMFGIMIKLCVDINQHRVFLHKNSSADILRKTTVDNILSLKYNYTQFSE